MLADVRPSALADKQDEVVLHARLHADDVMGMVAEAPDFDDAADQAGVGEEARDEVFRKLIETGVPFGMPTWSSEEGAPRVLETVRRKFLERHAGLIAFAAALRRMRPIWLRSVSHIALSRRFDTSRT